jgi:hypothetical protein
MPLIDSGMAFRKAKLKDLSGKSLDVSAMGPSEHNAYHKNKKEHIPKCLCTRKAASNASE